ncbi:MAG: hypothetical protein Q8873_00530 [Bacillota bacterium]|nr:hypothetical protein [Bacillota bacterium]
MFVRIIDSNGLFIRDDFVDELTEFTVETPCPDGFYLPKWDGSAWVEGKTAEEIAAIKAAASAAQQPTDSERISELETLVLQIGGII